MGYYLVNVGPNEENAGGVGARGYWIRRSGATVIRTWGAVDVDGARGGTFYWRGVPRERTNHFRSSDEAASYVRQILREKVVYADGGYRRLPPPNKIR
jgi:hypothetical protein